jgi:acylaminoacyl-peptidase
LLYTAEEIPAEEDPNDPFRKFRFEPTFGERFVGRKRPALFLAKWGESGSVHRVRISNSDEAQPVFPSYLGHSVFISKDEDELLTTQYHMAKDGRKLGIAHCSNRPSSTIKLTLDDKGDNVSASGVVIFSERPSRSPRVWFAEDENERLAVWLSYFHEPHGSCASLHVTDFSSEPKTIVRAVTKPKEAEDFPGLYLDQLPPTPFIEHKGRPFVVTHSAWGSRRTVVLIDLENGGVVDLTPCTGELWSWTVLACDGKDKVVAVRASPVSPQELVVGRVGGGGNWPQVKWTALDKADLPESS